MELSGGKLEVESEKNVGTNMIVKFPKLNQIDKILIK